MSAEVESEAQVVRPSAWDVRTLYSGKVLVLLAVAMGFTLVTMLAVDLLGGAEQFRRLVEGAGVWAPLVYVLLKASTYVIAPLSGTTVKLASGALFGVWDGMALSLAGDILGGCLNYWIARSLGRRGVTLFAGKKALAQIDTQAQRVQGWGVLIAARFLLSPIYDFISYAAGLARISFAQYFIVTALGGIPISLLYAALGNAAVGNKHIGSIMFGVTVFALGLIGALHLAQRKRKKTSDR